MLVFLAQLSSDLTVLHTCRVASRPSTVAVSVNVAVLPTSSALAGKLRTQSFLVTQTQQQSAW